MQLISHVEGRPCPQDIVKQGRNTNRPITGLRNWPYLWPALSIQKMKGCKKNISQKISLLVDRSDAAAGDRKASQAAQNEASYRFPKKIYLVTLCQWGTGVGIRWIEVVWSSFVTSFLFLPVVFFFGRRNKFILARQARVWAQVSQNLRTGSCNGPQLCLYRHLNHDKVTFFSGNVIVLDHKYFVV